MQSPCYRGHVPPHAAPHAPACLANSVPAAACTQDRWQAGGRQGVASHPCASFSGGDFKHYSVSWLPFINPPLATQNILPEKLRLNQPLLCCTELTKAGAPCHFPLAGWVAALLTAQPFTALSYQRLVHFPAFSLCPLPMCWWLFDTGMHQSGGLVNKHHHGSSWEPTYLIGKWGQIPHGTWTRFLAGKTGRTLENPLTWCLSCSYTATSAGVISMIQRELHGP